MSELRSVLVPAVIGWLLLAAGCVTMPGQTMPGQEDDWGAALDSAGSAPRLGSAGARVRPQAHPATGVAGVKRQPPPVLGHSPAARQQARSPAALVSVADESPVEAAEATAAVLEEVAAEASSPTDDVSEPVVASEPDVSPAEDTSPPEHGGVRHVSWTQLAEDPQFELLMPRKVQGEPVQPSESAENVLPAIAVEAAPERDETPESTAAAPFQRANPLRSPRQVANCGGNRLRPEPLPLDADSGEQALPAPEANVAEPLAQVPADEPALEAAPADDDSDAVANRLRQWREKR